MPTSRKRTCLPSWRAPGACPHSRSERLPVCRRTRNGQLSTDPGRTSQRSLLSPYSEALVHVPLGLRAGKMFVEVRQTFDFSDVRIVHSNPLFRAGPFPFPVLRIEQRVLN